MIFDVYKPFLNKEGRWVPGIKPTPTEWGTIVDTLLKNEEYCKQIDEYRETGDKSKKETLPAINFVGRSTTTRQASAMTPTQLFMIDIDHCEDPRGAWQKMFDQVGNDWVCDNVILAHITPSGKGLHIIFKQMGHPTLIENMDAANEIFDFGQYGEYDTKVKDFARISFIFKYDELLFENAMLDTVIEPDLGNVLVNDFKDEEGGKKKEKEMEIPPFSDVEKEQFDNMEYRGFKVKDIVKTYVEKQGTPSSGEIHNYYNEMVKYFRLITSNNKRCLLYLLPRFDHTEEECWGQIKSICRTNTLSELPKPFYFFLKDNGFYVPRDGQEMKSIQSYMLSDDDIEPLDVPYLPPVIREFVKCAPRDFVVPAINALMPILGTLTSYVKAKYPYDNKWQSTTFFSIIIAPPSTGKGFVTDYQDMLFENIRLRDFISLKREEMYLDVINRKGDNEKSPEKPRVSLRIIPPKNSETEFLEKQSYNCGYHMFTFAAEMDSWAKGVKAAGGNKDDMIRVAWDNGLYGQSYKAANSFKGEVNLFWNVLITGTRAQVEKYFRNVENGLVTRCCFTPIENQEFRMAPHWKELSEKDITVIRDFMKRCDDNSYYNKCTATREEALSLMGNAEEFDKEIDWRFKFKEKQIVNLDWIMPTLNKFQEEQCSLASKDIDNARDVFRRRAGLRGFRLALLCTCLYKKPRKRDFEKCAEFIWWWMHKDIESMLNMWGTKYNTETADTPNLRQRKVFSQLPDTFTRADVMAVCLRQGIKTKVRRILFEWRNQGFVTYVSADDKNTFKKIIKE